jgi:phthalate 4,5-dioxygenase
MNQQENEQLCRVGPGSDMGETMRRYWHPVALARQLPEPDCAPLRVRLLGENFVMFRDSEGRVGMLDELCMHRCASLATGRVEGGGIRCVYHGWKFAVDGTILETPNHADPRLRERRKARAYPVVESSGMLWAYIGPAEKRPPFRRFAPHGLPEDQLFVFRVNLNVNYLQVFEGGLDSSHVTMLHTNQSRPSWGRERGQTQIVPYRVLEDPSPRFDVEDTDFGYHYSASRRIDDGGPNNLNIRIVPAIMPTGRIIPGGPSFSFYVWETPVDDTHTATFNCVYSHSHSIDRDMMRKMLGLNDSRLWSEDSPDFKGSWENNFFQNRPGMGGANWTGLEGIVVEDAMMAVSMGPMVDRSRESLVPADMAVARIRRRLKDAIEMTKRGENPPGVMIEDMTSVAAIDHDVAEEIDWRTLAPFHHALLQAAQ